MYTGLVINMYVNKGMSIFTKYKVSIYKTLRSSGCLYALQNVFSLKFDFDFFFNFRIT